MGWVHCEVCCLRVTLNRDSTMPKHYAETTEGIFRHGAQRVCKASGTTRYTLQNDFRWTCQRPRSGQTCPCCGRKPMTLNSNGKFPKHKAPNGGRCTMSEAN